MSLVDWTEKVKSVMGSQTYAVIERAVGWSPNSLSSKLAGKHMPRADAGVKLARAIGVAVEWLFDDSIDLPPWPPYERVKQDADAYQLVKLAHEQAGRRAEDSARYGAVSREIDAGARRRGSQRARRNRGRAKAG